MVNTSQEGNSSIYQAGRYLDRVVQTPAGLALQIQTGDLRHAAGADLAGLPDMTTQWVDVAAAADVMADEVIAAEAGGHQIALFRIDGEVFALLDQCSHGYARLSDGYVEDGCVECPLHQGLVDIRTGEPRSAPITDPVRRFPARVVRDRVEVGVDLP